MQAFQRDLDKFEKLNAQVLGVSPDSIATHEEFSTKNGLQYPLVADEAGENAPPFEAASTRGTLRLADYRGKWNVVLVFYFADFTPV